MLEPQRERPDDTVAIGTSRSLNSPSATPSAALSKRRGAPPARASRDASRIAERVRPPAEPRRASGDRDRLRCVRRTRPSPHRIRIGQAHPGLDRPPGSASQPERSPRAEMLPVHSRLGQRASWASVRGPSRRSRRCSSGSRGTGRRSGRRGGRRFATGGTTPPDRQRQGWRRQRRHLPFSPTKNRTRARERQEFRSCRSGPPYSLQPVHANDR